MEQLESRALGKPKETIEHYEESETPAQRMLRQMSDEEVEAIIRGDGQSPPRAVEG